MNKEDAIFLMILTAGGSAFLSFVVSYNCMNTKWRSEAIAHGHATMVVEGDEIKFKWNEKSK